MGCTSSKGKFETAGNLLVDGFLRYTQMSGQGWTKTKSSNGRKEIHLEVYQADAPLGTWRGFVFLDGVSLEDTLAYVKAKLGTDNYELLETDDDEWIFRELFDFNIDGEGKEGLNPHAGDHRGETAERMEGGIVIHDPRKTNLKGNARSHEKILEEPGGVSERDMSVSERDVSQSLHKESPIEGKNDDDDSSSDEEEEPKKKSKEDNSKEESVFEVNASLTNLMDDPQKSTKNFNWSSILFSSSRKTITKKNAKQEPSEKPANREMIFKRQDFGLGMSKAVVIAQSAKYNKRVTAGAKRCTVHMLGCQLEEFIERKKPRVKLTFVCSIDPDLAPWEKPLATEEALSLLGGKLRVERFLTKAADYFAIPSNKLINRFRNIAAAPNGEMGWEEVERSKNELQLGTNVQHPTYGHGVVQSFDMKGRVRVVYDSKTTVDHEVEEKDDLRVTVIIGTRVVHPERGAGTVKAFDELGRIHVKFDNGDLHRYKQDAWKKKMNTVKLMGIGGALGTVKLSWRPYENIREGMGRVKFAVGVSTEAVLEYILESNSQHSDEDLKSGTVLERRVVEKINDHERIIYENRKMPPPLTPRDFVFKEIWCEVAPKTYVILYESVTLSSLPDNPRTVRGELHLTGWLLEPLYLNEESYDGDDHICKITYQMCVDVKGFVSPDSVEAVRQGQLLAALTDTRAYFWAQSQQKQKAKLRNRQSKRMSGFAPPEEKSIQGNLQGGMKKMASKLIMPPPPADVKHPDKKLKARGLTVYIADLRNCTTREQEQERVFQELANIRSKFAQKNKQLTSYDRKKYVWKLVYTHLMGYDVDFGHMQAIELVASPTFSEKMCGYLALSVLVKGSDEIMTLVVNTIKRDLALRNQEPVQSLALSAIANIGGRDMAHALSEDVRRMVQDDSTPVNVRKKAILALLRIHRENPRVVRLPSELEIANLLEPENILLRTFGLGLSASALLRHMIEFSNTETLEGEEDDPEEEKARFLRQRQRPQVQAIVVRLYHNLSTNRICPPEYFYHGTANPFLQVILLQILLAIGSPPVVDEIREPLYEGLLRTVQNVKWSKSSTINNSSRCVAFEAIALTVAYGKQAKRDLVDSCIDLLGKFLASKNANTRYLALTSMTNIARIVAERYATLSDAQSDHWQIALGSQQQNIVASLKDPDTSVRKRALDLLFHVCNEENAHDVVTELLTHLGSAQELPAEFKEEMVLRIAVLAERFAKTSKWYLEIAMKLILAGDEHVGDDVWHRIAQIIANQEELQTSAALQMYKALLQQGAVPTSMIKVAAYVIGEFGYLLTEYSTLNSGDLDHDVLAIDLFGACHRHFTTADPQTKIVLLTAYSKLLNIYEVLEVPVQEVFESQKHATDSEVQQRACEYSALARLNVTTMNQVLEPMPPWPESNKSKLLDQLEKISKGTDGNKTSKSTVQVSPRITEKRPPSSEESELPISPVITREKVKTNPKPPPKRPLEDLLDFDTPVQPPRPTPSSPSSLEHAKMKKYFLNALLSTKSLLFEDGMTQIGSHQIFSKGSGTVELFVGNLSQNVPILAAAFEISNPNTSQLQMQIPDRAGKMEMFDIAPGTQKKFAFGFTCIKPFITSPELILISTRDGHHLARITFPVCVTSFLDPFAMENTVFEQKWRQLETHSQSHSQEVSLSECSPQQWNIGLSKTSRLLELVKGYRIQNWPMYPISGVHDFAATSTFTSTEGGVAGVLMRIEMNELLQTGKISVRSTSQFGASQAILGILLNQTIRLFKETN